MTKTDLVSAICEKVGFSKKESTIMVDSVFEIMKKALENDEKVKISGFGNFNTKKKVRRGRNPQTGEGMEISARNVLVFKASSVLKKALNT